jgi:flagellar FliL protein
MTIQEQRVIGAPRQQIGGNSRPAIGASPKAPAPVAPAKKSRKGLAGTIVACLLTAGISAGGAWFVLKPDAGQDAANLQALNQSVSPDLGAIIDVEPVSINLAGGHYLRIGLSLQMTEDAPEVTDTARVLDIIIGLYSGLPMDQVTSPSGRQELKADLAEQVSAAYGGQVTDVFFTSYVTQ